MCVLTSLTPNHQAIKVGFKYSLMDNASYMFDNMPRIWKEGYAPTNQDILRARLTSTGIVTFSFKFEQDGCIIPVDMHDVGGQRGERSKWLCMMEGLDMLIVVISATEYCQTLEECSSGNRLLESLQILEGVLDMPTFINTPVLVLLNKVDLLDSRIAVDSPSNYFDDYEGAYFYCLVFWLLV